MLQMLRELYIENLVVIEKANIELSDGLNIFTGETGAGKSILINGINAVLGQRTTKDIVRTGAKKAVISAAFDDIPHEAVALLGDNGIDCDDGQIVVTREISSDGGSIARINSRPVGVSLLRELGAILVNIHGQHDNQALLSPDKHLQILDGFADMRSLLDDYRKDFKELQSVSREIKRLSMDEQQKAQRIKQLAQIVNDIKPLELAPDEDTEIEKRFEHADSSRELSSALSMAVAELYGDDADDIGAGMKIASASRRLEGFTSEFSDLEPLLERLSALRIELDDITGSLMRLANSVEIEPGEFARISKRRDEILTLKQKYRTDVGGLIKLCEESGDELLRLTDGENGIDALNERRNALLKQVSQKAAALSSERERAAEMFCKKVAEQLAFLNMPDVTLAVSHEKGKLTISGMDSIEFLISANAGESPKPIAKIASGGELSRIMLALKCVLAGKDEIPTMIFDEIDTGVSGRAAQKIGIKLSELSQAHQVLCVTHLSQIAVYADEHLLIEKKTADGSATTSIMSLDYDGRINEIARILGGESVTEITLKNAQELIYNAKNSKTVS